jgi:hypothetical protein
MTSYRLKLIAVIAMTIDHIGKILGQPFLLRFLPDALAPTYWVTQSFEWVGRLAFPLFAFMIAEGCAALPALAYNGQRGKAAKWICYVYYPAHLLGLFGIALLMI